MIKNNKIFNTCYNKAGGVLFCVFMAAVFAVFGASSAQAQTAMVTKVSTNFIDGGSTFSNSYFMCGQIDPVDLVDVSYMTTNGGYSNANLNTYDPWHNSALIEFDQYVSSGDNDKHYYPNNCLRLCATVTCANPARQTDGSTGTSSNTINTTYYVSSSDFPIQSVLFELFKYQPNSNPYNADSTPPIRTIALTPAGSTAANTCYGVGVWQTETTSGMDTTSCCELCGTFDTDNPSWQGACQSGSTAAKCQKACASTCKNFKDQAQCEAGTSTLDFCAGWDGSYEIDGEFGKSNGQFGFRANIQTKWPGDGVSSGDVEVNHTMAYPGVVSGHLGTNSYNTVAQIPIQVDVTNVHSVRSSSTMVGATTKVPAQPYELTYKLSKDATTTITISDPGNKCTCGHSFDPSTGTRYSYQCNAGNYSEIQFDMVKKQPRIGEGIPNGTNVNLDSWDGRDDKGNFLPYGNYLVSVTASTYDEWKNVDSSNGLTNVPDISQTVTRQLSLDPLKITDIKETGLAKLSTSYAKIDYVLTESANVHVMVFTPGTYFDNNVDMVTQGDAETTILSRAKAGTLVDRIVEQKQGRVNVNTKWDGICRHHDDNGTPSDPTDDIDCPFNGTNYSYGTPMPDGDYVYVMWAEIPYPSNQTISGYTGERQINICVNGKWWDGVKTHKFYNGILPINRGLPEITVGAVGYTSLGSSPTAFGLDPFTFNYAVSRDSIVDATIKTTANEGETPYVVKELLTNEVAIAAKENKFTWDGLDKYGRYVSPGNYMVEFVAKDSLYPEKQATMTVQFPVDMFRVVDVKTTPILDTATSQATISYTLSKSMDVVVEIYDQDVIIPTNDCVTNYNPTTSLGHGGNFIIDQSVRVSPCWCQYVSSTTASGVNATLIPVNSSKLLKSFTLPKAGEGMTITEIWDGLKRSVEDTSGVAPLPDGNYPYRICTRTTQDIDHWYEKYYDVNDNPGNIFAQDANATCTAPGPDTGCTGPSVFNYRNYYQDIATDKPTGFITIARGSIAFNKVLITPSQPKMKYSSETIYLPAYEVGFSTSRSASVKIEVLSTAQNQCLYDGVNDMPAGTVCRTLSAYAYDGNGIGYFDPTKIYKVYWDGKDSKGNYVKYGSYEFKLTGLPYPAPAPTQTPMTGDVEGVAAGMPLPTIYSQVVSVNNFQVYDRYVEDITRDNPNAKFAYQISVPMKVAIQILKPGTMSDRTTITGNAIGLIDPVTGNNVTDINDVLVKSIVGIRPNLVSLDEIWDGTDYAGQEVPDGIYPYRYVTTLNAYDMDSVTGAINNVTDLDEAGAKVADWEKYITLENINVARGDSWYADVDWKSKKVTSFFPNPLNKDYGWFEIAKLPAPGRVSIKIYNIAGDLVREGNDFDCINSQGETDKLANINAKGGLQPYMNLTQNTQITSSRNFTLRCKWEKDNDHGKKVARGLYYAIMELDPTRGNAKKSQRVIKILIP